MDIRSLSRLTAPLEKAMVPRQAVSMSAEGNKPTAGRVALAQQLFDEFYAQCFWHIPRGFRVRAVDVETIIKGLRTYGGRRGFLSAALLCRSVTSKPRSSRPSRKTAA